MSAAAQVLVVGAGAAGMSAAIAAARAGAEVKLIERMSGPGGTVARALIHTLGGLYDADKQILNGGLPEELADRLFRASPLTRIRSIGKTRCLNLCPQVYQQVVEAWLTEESRIEQICGAYVTHVTLTDGEVVQCEVSCGDTVATFHPSAVIDTTGTAEVVRLIGSQYVNDDDQWAAGGLIMRLRNVRPNTLVFPKSITLVEKLGSGPSGPAPRVMCTCLARPGCVRR